MTYLQRLQGLGGEITICPPRTRFWSECEKLGYPRLEQGFGVNRKITLPVPGFGLENMLILIHQTN